jgi:site-specific recombinase XerD
MNKLLSNPREFSSLVQRYFLERLVQQKNASPRTIEAYRDTFRLLLTYRESACGKSPQSFTLNELNSDLILKFLDHLESVRHSSIRTRNARLTALHSFARYVSLKCPPALDQCQQILAIPSKRFEKPMLGFLSREEVQALLAAANRSTWSGRRDYTMLALLYNTGARVSELIALRVSDLAGGCSPSIRLRGKGRKQRTVPLWKETATQVRQWVQTEALSPDDPLLPSRFGEPMSRTNVAERLSLLTLAASAKCASLKVKRVTPHMFRHTTAMHLLQSGVDITVIALWLGHESPCTTHAYVEADLSMKQRALNSLTPPSGKKLRYHAPDSLLKFLEGL